MNLETVMTLVAVLGTFLVLVSCIVALLRQVANLHRLLNETTREYKMYQALVNHDYPTAGVLRNGLAGVPKEPEVEEEEEEPEPPLGSVVNQF
jgi:hypothetical protein